MLKMFFVFHILIYSVIKSEFSSFLILDIKIQSESHDSTEDAYTALKLFLKYQDIIDSSGEEYFDRELEILYDTGRQLNWQVP